MNQKKLEQYAELLLREGLALQKGQFVTISTSLDTVEFARIAAKEAFKQGASDVRFDFHDNRIDTLRVNHAAEEILSAVTPRWMDLRDEEDMAESHALLSLLSPNRKASAGTDPYRLALSRKNRSETAARMNNAVGGNQLRWCVCSMPNPDWAKEVFPNLSAEDGCEKLWEEILDCCYMNREGGWSKHVQEVHAMRDRLNALKLTSMHFTSGIGTDLTVKLIPGAIFQGGAEEDPNGVQFCANIPSEELFTSPDRLGTEGVVAASMPLLRAGELIQGIKIRFEKGRAVEAHADSGEESLLHMLETDENAHYLGETALVTTDSPIWKKGHLFYNTLFDENAACHLALGTGFPSVVEGNHTEEELLKMGINQSIIHCDFMFGTEDLECIGTCQDGSRVTVMKNGRFVL